MEGDRGELAKAKLPELLGEPEGGLAPCQPLWSRRFL